MNDNSAKITYILVNTVESLLMLALAVAAPIYITPGYYWWTVFAIAGVLDNGTALTKRLDSWGWTDD